MEPFSKFCMDEFEENRSGEDFHLHGLEGAMWLAKGGEDGWRRVGDDHGGLLRILGPSIWT